MVLPTERRLTVEDYWEITHLPEFRDKRYELVNGALGVPNRARHRR
jgi:hypothetical protein